jgi:carboxypeptidase Taq
MDTKSALEQLKKLDREIKSLHEIEAVLGWDQQVYMPERGVHGRGEQLAMLAGEAHRRETNPEIGDLLDKLGASDANPLGSESLNDPDRRLIRAIYRDFKQATRLPAELMQRIARVTTNAHAVWTEARKKDDFKLFQPHLEEIVDMMLEVADRLGYEEHPYDALLDQYEPEMKTSDVASVFRELREGLVPLVRRIRESRQVDNSFLLKKYPAAEQEAFGRKVLEAMQFDQARTRLDASVHPFTTSFGGDDVRITTRYDENYVPTSLFGIIHEGGHGLYELGFTRDFHGTRLADGASLGIHESMSRFWENVVGRGRAFWHHFFPIFKSDFPSQLDGVDLETFYKGVNRVEPSLIRVEADEVTYSLHIILRFELERMLIARDLKVADLPDAWREQSQDLLGIVPNNDANGVLQDIHWSGGAIGYFPTYALGNVYGLQFVSAMRREMPDMDNQIRNGELGNIKNWLDAHIHGPGRSETPAEICERVTGEPMTANYFIDYVTAKYTDVYDL